ncbi:hypothetical protein HK096_000694, partial [Nowakowskiella sp. JEL0078]
MSTNSSEKIEIDTEDTTTAALTSQGDELTESKSFEDNSSAPPAAEHLNSPIGPGQFSPYAYYDPSQFGQVPYMPVMPYYQDYYYLPVLPTSPSSSSGPHSPQISPPTIPNSPLTPKGFGIPPYAVPPGGQMLPFGVSYPQSYTPVVSPRGNQGESNNEQQYISKRTGSANQTRHPHHLQQDQSQSNNLNQTSSNSNGRSTSSQRYHSPYRNPNNNGLHSPSINGSHNSSHNLQKQTNYMAQHFRNPQITSPSSSTSSSAGFNSGPNKHQRSLSNTSTGSIGNNNTNIYIRGLSNDTTDDWLYDVAKDFGSIVSSKAIIDMPTNVCKGFGFVMYESEREARQAMDGFNNMGYQVSFARVRPNTPFPLPVRPQYPVFSHVNFVPFQVNQNGAETSEVIVKFLNLPTDTTYE